MSGIKSRKAIAYLRVSTGKQGRSGLGLEAQQADLARYVAANGLDILQTYEEVETGKGANALSKRPQLVAALAHAKREKARLVIAKLDRLARNVHFISGLMETGVDFAVADMPNADRFQLHIFAALAEREAEVISQRTKNALKAAKERHERGELKPDGTPYPALGKHGKLLAQRNRDDAIQRASESIPELLEMRASGMSMRKIVDTLNDRGTPSPTGGKWHLTSLHRMMARVQMPAEVLT